MRQGRNLHDLRRLRETDVTACNHIPGEGCTLVTAADGCSLECTACREIIVECELASFVVSGEDVEWVE